ncbi:acyl-CoA thioesterase [Algoriphagus zhangzhouensis]|uniref:Acyl-CoA thioester hydrolase n=1 Tax=Algoriphagus zhangzhouensis TaxID=1073327 RepID=A0A1M7ZIR1_9BACT|nr:thioesterase family protein [Algoriphagus zhangzhouensis]TDY43724.1 acyl-CoA thioester hydrolase [Algoriphagus zhangzhouensis]SHO64763.1 acyl-CoA thioester hydrolase [Algoriphagus zhangzhouensis]
MNHSVSLDSFDFSTPIQIRFSDIDGYLHVNNGIYFNYFEHSRAEFLHKRCQWDIMKIGAVVARVEMDYFRPIHLEDQVKALVKCTRVGNTSFVLEQYLVGNSESENDLVFAKCICTMVSVDMKTMKPTPVPELYKAKLLNQPEKQA